MCSSHIRRTDVLKHSWVDCSRIAERYGGPKVSRQFQFFSPAISICSRQFQFTHRDFNLLTATISIYLRQFQFTRGNFNFAHGNFNLLTAISTFSRQRSRHFSLSSPPVYYGGWQWPPKVKTQNQKSMLKVDLQSEKWKSNIKSRFTNTYASRQWEDNRRVYCSQKIISFI